MVWISGWPQTNAPRPPRRTYPTRRHGTALQIHHDRAVGAPFALGPFIDADHLHASDGWPGALLQPAQDRVVTDRHAEAAAQSFTRPAAEGVAHQLGDQVRPARPAAVDVCDPRQ